MTAALLEADSTTLDLYHVPMRFSRRMDQIGVIRPRKIIELAAVIGRIWRARMAGCTIMYYPPAGPTRAAIIRDIAVLGATRWMFPVVVFHFHAGGVSCARDRLPIGVRQLFDLAYRHPSLAIRPAEAAPRDGAAFGAHVDTVVEYGIADPVAEPSSRTRSVGPISLLYVGAVRESKGVHVLLQALAHVVRSGFDCRLEVVGEFAGERERERALTLTDDLGLADHVRFRGLLVGDAKQRAYQAADLFCFPSHYESEAGPVVLIEALANSLPIVATRWRGIPSVVGADSAILVEPRDSNALAAAIAELAADPARRRQLGESGRRRYEAMFTVQRYQARLTDAILAAAR